MNNEHYKYLLNKARLPKSWYNINADMPVPLTPVLNPQIGQITAEFSACCFLCL